MEQRELFRAKLRELYVQLPESATEFTTESNLDLDRSIALYTAGTWFPEGMTRLEWMEHAIELIRAEDRQQVLELEALVGFPQGFAVCAAVLYGDLGDDFPDIVYHDAASIEACHPQLRKLLELLENRALAMQSLEYYCERCDEGVRSIMLGAFELIEDLLKQVESLESDLIKYAPPSVPVWNKKPCP